MQIFSDETLAHYDLDQDELAHYGKKGMKWGQTKAGAAGGSPNSFFNKPSVAKAIVLGSYGKKSAYTNPAALAQRKTAGKLRIAAVLGSVGGSVISQIGSKNGNVGLTAAGGILSAGAGLVGVASLVKGVQGAHEESLSRKDAGIS